MIACDPLRDMPITRISVSLTICCCNVLRFRYLFNAETGP